MSLCSGQGSFVMLMVAGRVGFATMGFFSPGEPWFVCPSCTSWIPEQFSNSGWEHRAGLLLNKWLFTVAVKAAP